MSHVSKKGVLVEYVVVIKHWYEGFKLGMEDMPCIRGNQNVLGVKRGMKGCARYKGAMLVGKYMETN